MSYKFRTMIIPDAIAATVRALASQFGPSASGMWTTALSPSGELPATHWISTGQVGVEFAAIMPFSHFDRAAELGEEPAKWVTDAYDATAFVQLAESAGVKPPPVEQINQIMAMVDVSEQDPFAAMERLGLKLIQTAI